MALISVGRAGNSDGGSRRQSDSGYLGEEWPGLHHLSHHLHLHWLHLHKLISSTPAVESHSQCAAQLAELKYDVGLWGLLITLKWWSLFH